MVDAVRLREQRVVSDPRDVVYGPGLRRRLHRRVKQEQLAPPAGAIVADDELATLPAPAQRWLRFNSHGR